MMSNDRRRIGIVIGCSALAAALGAPAPGQAQTLEEAVARLTPELIELRHRIHQNPELSNRETETAALVAARLRALGLDEVRTGVAHTGVVGVLRGSLPGPTIAVRADMDALPVVEQTDLPFKSTKKTTFLGQEVGVMHACGHDVHTTVGLGVAGVLASLRDRLPGTVLFLFQPAEEGAPRGEEGGAALMIREGALRDPAPEAIFGLHAAPELAVGQVGYTPGPALAAVDHFYITIWGKQSHGAAPHLGVDPIVVASEVVQALQTIRSRTLPPLEPSVVTVGVFHGGERFNIIPQRVKLEGTVRTYDRAAQDKVEERMLEILDGITSAHGASFEFTYDRVTPATINDVELTEASLPSLERAVGAESVVQRDPVMGGEDFAYFANAIPGFYFWLGVEKPGFASGGLHTPTFRADDGAIPVGVRAMTQVALEYLQRNARN